MTTGSKVVLFYPLYDDGPPLGALLRLRALPAPWLEAGFDMKLAENNQIQGGEEHSVAANRSAASAGRAAPLADRDQPLLVASKTVGLACRTTCYYSALPPHPPEPEREHARGLLNGNETGRYP